MKKRTLPKLLILGCTLTAFSIPCLRYNAFYLMYEREYSEKRDIETALLSPDKKSLVFLEKVSASSRMTPLGHHMNGLRYVGILFPPLALITPWIPKEFQVEGGAVWREEVSHWDFSSLSIRKDEKPIPWDPSSLNTPKDEKPVLLKAIPFSSFPKWEHPYKIIFWDKNRLILIGNHSPQAGFAFLGCTNLTEPDCELLALTNPVGLELTVSSANIRLLSNEEVSVLFSAKRFVQDKNDFVDIQGGAVYEVVNGKRKHILYRTSPTWLD